MSDANCLQVEIDITGVLLSQLGSRIVSDDNQSSQISTFKTFFGELHSSYFSKLLDICQTHGKDRMVLFASNTVFFESFGAKLISKLFMQKSIEDHLTDSSSCNQLDLVNYLTNQYKLACIDEVNYADEKEQTELLEQICQIDSNVIEMKFLPNYKDIHPALKKRNEINNSMVLFELERIKVLTISLINNPKVWELILLDTSDYNYRRLRLTVLNEAVQTHKSHTLIKEYHAYFDNGLQKCSPEEILEAYETIGDVSISFVKNLSSFTQSEKDNIRVLQTLVETRKHLIVKKIVNRTSDSEFNAKSNNKDKDRRAYGVSFNTTTDDINTSLANKILLNIWNDIVKLGLVDPKSNPRNGSGDWGVDLLDKDYGCDVQMKHFDFPQYKGKKYTFLSFNDMMKSPEKRASYNNAQDGSASVFVNPFGFADYLLRGDGTFIVIPPYSYIVLRGNVMHCGTGNYSQFGGVYKIFFYVDAPNYARKDTETQYSVFFPFGHEFHTVVRNANTDDVVKFVIIPHYNCSYCGTKARYSHPYCKDCLQLIWDIKLSYSQRNFSLTYVGLSLPIGHVFPVAIWGDIVTACTHRIVHSDLNGEHICAIQLNNTLGVPVDMYLDCFLKKSFVGYLTFTMTKSTANVALQFDSESKTIHMVCTSEINCDDKLLMYLNYNPYKNKKYVVDLDNNAVKYARNQ